VKQEPVNEPAANEPGNVKAWAETVAAEAGAEDQQEAGQHVQVKPEPKAD